MRNRLNLKEVEDLKKLYFSKLDEMKSITEEIDRLKKGSSLLSRDIFEISKKLKSSLHDDEEIKYNW